MSSTESKKWGEMTDVNLLVHIIVKCGTSIPYNEIAAEFGITPAAVRSKIDRLKRKYKNGTSDATAGDGSDSDEEAAVVPKKRKRAVKISGKSQRGKKVKVEEDEEEQVLEDDKEE